MLLVIEETVRRIREAHPDVSYIYYTGDSVDHGHWQRTAQGNRDIMARIYSAFRTYFPGVPVYVTLGNHEGKYREAFKECIQQSYNRFDLQLQLIQRTCKYLRVYSTTIDR